MSAHTYRETLKHRGLQPFLWTQFLGAFNDNLFKIVVSMLAVHAAAGGSGRARAVAGRRRLHPAVPAVLRLRRPARRRLQQAHGARRHQVARDRRDRLSAWSRFIVGPPRAAPTRVLFLIALQATFFSPAKYGILPEMLPDRDLSRANGVLEMSTFVAIVARHGRRRLSCSTRGTTSCWLIGVAGRRRSPSSAPRRASAFRACRRPRRRRASAGTRGARSALGLEAPVARSRAVADGRSASRTSGSSARCCSW